MKYIVTLQEPLWRRALRYFLWTIISLATLSFVIFAIKNATAAFTRFQLSQSAALLSQFDSASALVVSEKLLKDSPTLPNRLLLIKTALDANEGTIAAAALEPVASQLDNPAILSAAATLAADESPESLPSFIPRLSRILPEGALERLTLARACIAINSPELTETARRLLSGLERGPFKDRAALLRLKLSLQTSDHDAAERASALLEKNLNPTEAVELLSIAEKLQLPETADYRSTLKVRSRASIALALRLSDHLALSAPPQSVADFLASLPATVSQHPEVRLKRFVLSLTANNSAAALSAIDGLEPSTLKDPLTTIAGGGIPSLEALGDTELATLARLGEALHKPALTQRALAQLTKTSPSLWAYSHLATANQTLADHTAAVAAWQSFATLSGTTLSKLPGTYYALLTQQGEFLPLYQTAKQIAETYPQLPLARVTLSLAHLRMGNGTDALLALPESPTNPREQFLRGYLLARAGQTSQAAALLKDIFPSSLLPAEKNLFDAATRKLEESSPLKQWMDLIK